MKRFRMYPLVIVMLLLFMTACSDNFLSPKPKSFYTPENIFTDKAGFEAQLVTMRKNLTQEQTGYGALMMQQWAYSDANVPISRLNVAEMTPSTQALYNFNASNQINEMYRYIKDSNVVISRIDNIEWKDQKERNATLAEALWHRAYWYYRMVGNYGDVPWIGEEVKGAKLDFNTYSREAIFEKLESDLEFAVQHLPESAKPGAITKGAGNHLLAKIYLADLKFDKSIEAATRVINGPYSLMTQRFGVDADDPKRNVIWDLHRPANKNDPANDETILAFVDRFEAPVGARTVGTRTMRSYHAAYYKGNHRDSEGNRGMIDAGAMYDTLGRGNPNTMLTQWYQYDVWNDGNYQWDNTPDLRRADINWVDINELRYNNPESVNYGDPWQLKWMTGNKYGVFWEMYAIPFYKTYVPQNEPNAQPVGGNGDWYIFRLAGTYLIRAEAHYWKGEIALAAADINKVRKRAHAPLISASDVTIDYIFDERARELFAESPRQNELARVSYIMAEKGINGYSEENIANDNWAYDRILEKNSFYPNYTGHRKKSILGLPLPVGDKLVIAGQSSKIAPHNFQWPIDDQLINRNTLGTINQNIGYQGAENNKPPKENIEETSYESKE